ncbi:MAG: nucleotide sugar dehydrogenase [Anaerolineaceae bacterium]|nr:nucleotide sugar dehydrogenase [Anaerolineaceae bacterium]
MKIIVVGAGFVGLTHAAVSSEYGHDVWACDVDPDRLAAFRSARREAIEGYVNEPGLADIIADKIDRSLHFVDDLRDVIDGTDAIFLCLPTPSGDNGSADLSYYFDALGNIAPLLAQRRDPRRVVIINKSTVPVGTARRLEGFLREHGVRNFGIASNPEFLPEGEAVARSRHPDRVVVGADRQEDFEGIRRLYSQFHNHVRIQYIETTPETAEAIKYVSNTLLLTYISFWNGVGARLAETFPNVHMEDLKRGVTSDQRISTWGSYVSNGAGGSCFGKDIQSLVHQLGCAGQNTDLLEAVYHINEYQKVYLIERARQEAGYDFSGKTVALLGLAFKKKTNDVRDSSSLSVAQGLLEAGARALQAYDPLAMVEASQALDPARNPLFARIRYHESAEEALCGSDCLFISTDWEEFRGLSGSIERHLAPPALIVDGRRMIPDYQDLLQKGYRYLAVGSPFLQGDATTKRS